MYSDILANNASDAAPPRAPQFLSRWLGKTERRSRLAGFCLEESRESSGCVSSPRIQSSRTEHPSGRDQEVHERRAAPACRLGVFFVMVPSLCPLHPFEGNETGSGVMGKGGGRGSRRAADTPRVSGGSPTVRWTEGSFPSPAGPPVRGPPISRDRELQGRRQAPGREGRGSGQGGGGWNPSPRL